MKHNIKILLICSAIALYSFPVAAQPKIVAHRGFYMTEGSYENTVSSLANAQKLGVDGVEFDVNMTADDSLIVFHGPKILDTKLSAQKNSFAEIRNVILPGGHQIPTLREFLMQGRKDPSVTLFLEIKKHASQEREKQVVKAIVDLVEELDMGSQVQYISFSSYACEEILRIKKDATIVYVSSDLKAMRPEELVRRGYKGLSYQLNVMMNYPEIAEQALKYGLETTLWMVEDPELIDWAVRHDVTYISTDYPDKAKAYVEAWKAFKNK